MLRMRNAHPGRTRFRGKSKSLERAVDKGEVRFEIIDIALVVYPNGLRRGCFDFVRELRELRAVRGVIFNKSFSEENSKG